MKFLFLILPLVFALCDQAFAAAYLSQAQANQAEFELNKANPNAMQHNLLGSLVTFQKKGVLRATYKFSRDGGALGAHNLLSYKGAAIVLPKGAIVSDCLLDFRTAFLSGGSTTINFSTGKAAADLKSSLAIASATGLVTCIPVSTAATAIKMTSDSIPTMTYDVSALTAGEVNVLIEYWLSDP